ncbi:hypothetical protein JXM67_03205 [candidate division WOR-3 bacterium]|nr:hypothetical protein [candidate division WOR-3 bacterium]
MPVNEQPHELPTRYPRCGAELEDGWLGDALYWCKKPGFFRIPEYAVIYIYSKEPAKQCHQCGLVFFKSQGFVPAKESEKDILTEIDYASQDGSNADFEEATLDSTSSSTRKIIILGVIVAFVIIIILIIMWVGGVFT